MEEGVQLGKVVAVGECGLGALRQGGGEGGAYALTCSANTRARIKSLAGLGLSAA